MLAALPFLQFFFALTWVVYVIYLPALAAQAGIDKGHVAAILVMDQAIFIACDWAAGAYADRVARIAGRIGGWMAAVTALSCAAFIALPWVAPAAGAAVFLGLTAIWSATSSALRAPPMALASRRAEVSRQPRIAGFYLLGLGVAAAIAPYLAVALKAVDARIPFAAASISLAAFAALVALGERRGEAAHPHATPGAPPVSGAIAPFAFVILLFGLGFQLHFSINSTPGYLRFAVPEQLPHLMPVFWIGFNVAVLPVTVLLERYSGAGSMAAGGILGVVAFAACAAAQGLEALVVAQFAAGVAWALTLTSAASAALGIGRAGREGLVTGVLFSMLAAAALARLAVTIGGPSDEWMAIAPLLAWAVASALCVVLVRRAFGVSPRAA